MSRPNESTVWRTILRALTALSLMMLSGVVFAGYDVHITRKASWFDDRGPRISLAEWLQYVGSDPQIKRDPFNTENDFVVSLIRESFPLWFNPELGEIYTKDPSQDALAKMVEIATKLHVRVQGDDGEFYPPRR